MAAASHVLAIDQGTTSTRAIVFDRGRASRSAAASRSSRSTSRSPAGSSTTRRTIWRDTVAVCRQALAAAGVDAAEIAAIGITNQRETTVLWDRGDRPADPPRHRLAGPAHRGALPAR